MAEYKKTMSTQQKEVDNLKQEIEEMIDKLQRT